MLVTLLPSVMLFRLVQLAKALIPMLVILSGIVMLVRLSQLWKATEPIPVTLSGIVMLVRLVHLPNAPRPMLVTDLPSMVAGIISAPDAFLSQPVIVISSSLISYFKWGLIGISSVGLFSATGSLL